MIGVGDGNVFPVLQIEELRPGFDIQKMVGISRNVFYQNVFISLWSIGTHLQPQQAVGIGDVDAAQNDVAVVYGFASAGQCAVAETIRAVFYDDVGISSVVRVFIRPGAFAAFQGDGVIVDGHVAVLYQYVAAYIDVDGIRARCFYRLFGREDIQIQQLYMVAFVKVGGPEGRIDEAHSRELHVIAVGDMDQARTQFLHIGALRVDLAAQPE